MDASSDKDFPPSSTFGRYTNLQFLAEGGMGRVFKAYDPALDRPVALKFIQGNDPLLRDRLRLEARAQARIENEHICKVYEVGEIDGKLYIAMQFIPGKTLHEVGHLLSLEQKVKIIQIVAEAIHAAHRAGLVHRDLKPANILMQQVEDGKWFPFVTDFGLAREVQAPGLTVSGMIVGSPLYMSPEQAKGDIHTLDFRSDVYSLGVTLYELLSGKLPLFAEATMEALLKVLQEEPRPLRSVMPDVSADLETIAMKCLQKDPERRYESAKALAEDLQRFLEGEPIQAAPVTFRYRLWRRAAKHKVAAVLLLLLACTTLAMAGWVLRTKWYAQRQVYWMNQFSQQTQYVDSFMKYAYTSPLHNIDDEKKRVRERLKEIEERIEEEGEPAGGPGHFALGRGYMALEEYEHAKDHLELAWNRYNYQTPDVAYALGLNLVELHRKGLSEAERIPGKQEREAKEKELYRLYRLPAIDMIARGKAARAEAVEYVEALVAYVDKDYVFAVEKAQQCVNKIPWFYAADKLRGDAYSELGKQKNQSGKATEAMPFYEMAGKAYQEAIRKGPSFSSTYEEFAENELAIIEVRTYQTSEPFQLNFEGAVKACDSATTVNPQSSNAYRLKARACWRWGEHLSYHDQDPRPILKTAMEAARFAIRLAPNDHRPYSELGAASDLYGRYELAHGVDARHSYLEAISAYKKAVDLNPNVQFTHNSLGNAYLFFGIYENSRGLNSKNNLEKALASYHNAIQIGPYLFGPYCNQGLSYLALAEQESNTGRSPGEFLLKAVQCAKQCIEVNPRFAYCYRVMGSAFVSQGEYEMEHGLSPDASLESARSALQEAIQIKKDFNQTWLYEAKLETLEGRWSIAKKEPPMENFKKGREAFQEAIRISPDYADAYEAMAELCRFQAEWFLSQKQPAASILREGLAMVEKALSANPSLAEGKATQAHLYWLQSVLPQHVTQRKELIRQANLSIQQAFDMNPLLRNRHKDLQQRIQNAIEH